MTDETLGHHGPKDRDRTEPLSTRYGLDETEALAKDLAIKLAVRELEKQKPPPMSPYNAIEQRAYLAQETIKNLLIGLGCEAVVRAWEECS